MSSATTNQPFVFAPGASPNATGTDPLVSETRREIAEIVREVAGAVRSERTQDDFLCMLADRILRAMAAEGVLIWQRHRSQHASLPQYRCLHRLGRITDQSIPPMSLAVHTRLLVEVADVGQAVVVPATPGATAKDVPANPTDVPVALVPIDLESTMDGADFILEVFLEPDCGVATQRGYLRFVAQMADLAGEFLRADQLRRIKRNQALRSSIDAAIAKLHHCQNQKELEALIVDQCADLFAFDRVGLCECPSDPELIAVSHVNTIDWKSPAAQQICAASEIDLDEDGCAWFADPDEHDVELIVRSAVGPLDSQYRLVCLQALSTPATPIDSREELIRYAQHASLALESISRWSAIPGGRMLAALAPAMRARRSSIWKPIVATASLMTIFLVAAIFPIPLVVDSPATLRPQQVQTICAPRQAIVEQVHVQHGQDVLRGERLLTLFDPELEQQITSLTGRRAVLLQQQAHWIEAMVDTASNRMDRLEQVQGEQRLITQEIQSIDDELSVLKRAQEGLVVRADRNGTVDAWQVEQRLASRPLQRGDQLMQVIAKDSSWVLDAQVSQNRIAHIQDANADASLAATVALESDPNQTFNARLLQLGPSTTDRQTLIPTTAVLLQLSAEAAEQIAEQRTFGNQSGAPARVMFHCGKAPAGYLLFRDVIRSVRGTWGLYFGSGDNS